MKSMYMTRLQPDALAIPRRTGEGRLLRAVAEDLWRRSWTALEKYTGKLT